jgi:Tfp pilus assembly protein PilF
MRVILLGCFILCTLPSIGQQAKLLHESGQRFLQQNDFGNAILVLKKAVEQEPGNPDFVNDLGLAYYMAGQYKMGYELMKPFAESKMADDRSFLVCGMLLRGGKNIREADLVYRIGLQNFPKSGALYADFGEFLNLVEPSKNLGIEQWEKGIQFDPEYPGNYHHACLHYAESGDFIWSIVYGEVFVNLESYSSRTVEVKNVLFDSYKRLFAYGLEGNKELTGFEKEVWVCLQKQKELSAYGITPETLTAIRARFVLDWFHEPASRFPFTMFDKQRQLLREGVFDAYNQWLFGSVANVNAFQNWTKTHPDEYVNFYAFQRSNVLRVPAGQYYRTVPAAKRKD